MIKKTFCYEIHEDYGLAKNIETEENAKAYTSVDMDFKRELTEEEYKVFHEHYIIQLIVEQIKIDKNFIKPISLEEYLDETEVEF